MVKVVSFMYCESVQTDMSNGKPIPHLISPLTAIVPVSIPTNYSFCIFIGLTGFDFKERNTVEIKFKKPDGSCIKETGEMEIPLSDKMIGGINFNIDLRNITLNVTGEYKTEVYVNNKFLGEYPISVIGSDNNAK